MQKARLDGLILFKNQGILMTIDISNLNVSPALLPKMLSETAAVRCSSAERSPDQRFCAMDECGQAAAIQRNAAKNAGFPHSGGRCCAAIGYGAAWRASVSGAGD